LKKGEEADDNWISKELHRKWTNSNENPQDFVTWNTFGWKVNSIGKETAHNATSPLLYVSSS
jgi:hypothetical protein